MKTKSPITKLFLACALLAMAANVQSATTQLAPAPLITSPTASILPNVFLMVDDSGSMAWDYMPDNAGNFNNPAYGGASNQCNGVFYNPLFTYVPPVDSTGASYSASSFIGAWTNGYNTGAGTVDLSTSFVPSGGGTATAAYYYKYIGTQTTEAQKNYYNTGSTFYSECNTNASSSTITVGSGTGTSTSISSITVNGTQILSATTTGSTSTNTVASNIAANISLAGYHATVSGSVVTIWPPSSAAATFTPVITKSGGLTTTATAFPASPKFLRIKVSNTSGPGASDETTNFANWYSYYRTRLLMMKTATGLAFKPVGNTFRVGFGSMNNNTGSAFVQLGTFDTAHKAAWYNELYATTTGSSTPLRDALSKVGKMYANKLSGNTFNTVAFSDPIQYSCQQNFTLLSTDGFWNGTGGSKLDGTAMDNQDGNEQRPMYDGSLTSSTTVTPYTTVQTRQEVTSGASTTNTWSKTTTAIGSACSTTAVVPANTTTAYMTDNGKDIALGLSSTNPNSANPTRCINLAANAWICRGTNTAAPPVSQSTVTDSNGTPWYLVASASSLSGSCVDDQTSFGNSYSPNKGACPGQAAVSGKLVTTTPYTQLETTSGLTTSVESTYTATQTTTQSTSNGVVGPVGPLTPSTLTYVFTSSLPPVITGTATTSTGAWTAGGTTSVCTATASLPSAGTTTPAITATSTTGGTTTTTVLSTVGPTAGTPTTTTAAPSGGTSDTLADAAEYYYITDLRTTALGNCTSGSSGNTLCAAPVAGADIYNNVPSSGLDAATHQHMTTFTLGLGARGSMVFDPNYQNQTATSFTPADFYAVKQGSTPGAGVCSWQTTGSCIWPTPASNAIETIDDLWHAAVNGRGTYFSAANPGDLSVALTSALAGVSARTGAAAAATTSNAFVTQGDNFLFRSTFVTQQWTGELVRQQLDVNTGNVLPSIDWSAQAKLDALASRNIWFFYSPSGTKLSSFTHANLVTAGLDTNFNTAHISTLTQLQTGCGSCLQLWVANKSYAIGDLYKNGTTWYRVSAAYLSGASFGATDTTNAAVITGPEGVNLVNFIRGDRSNEGALTNTAKFYRSRSHILGDIVDAESIYVKGALASYEDPGYSTYITNKANRQSMVYVGANDGMLHAFYAADGSGITGGDEAWAYVPVPVMTNLYLLADKNYGINPAHQYFVDGSPVAADICSSNCTNASLATWKTILVGGLNNGGKGYYALDITDPLNPKGLWEFTDGNLGYTYGNPKVVKLKDGTWVVLLSSGYNNLGDGIGHLFVVNANTGALIRDIGTGIGDNTTPDPSGLGRIDAPVTSPGTNATAIAAYGGDLKGNVWRFDINGDLGATTPQYDAQLLTTLKDSIGNPQPITSKPLITLVGSNYVVNVGTGRYLGASDLSDVSQQSFYAIKDPLTTGTDPTVAIYASLRAGGSTFVHQTLTSQTCPVGSPLNVCSAGETVLVSSNTPVNFDTDGGWYFDFPLAGERDNTDAALMKGTLVINTNQPNSSACSVGGDSYQYQVNFMTGGSVSSSPNGVVGKKLFNEITSAPKIACLSNGSCNIYSQGSGGGTPTKSGLNDNEQPDGTIRRTSWRELTE